MKTPADWSNDVLTQKYIAEIQNDARDDGIRAGREECAAMCDKSGLHFKAGEIRALMVLPVPNPCKHLAYTIHKGVGGQEKHVCVNCPMYRFARTVPDCDWRKAE